LEEAITHVESLISPLSERLDLLETWVSQRSGTMDESGFVESSEQN
jgi:hypothetical protein